VAFAGQQTPLAALVSSSSQQRRSLPMDAQLALHQEPDEGHPKTASPLIATFETEIV